MYRSLLRTAAKYPSVKRASIIAEIKTAYRDNRSETDESKLALMEEEAHAALKLMSRFVDLKQTDHIEYSM